MGRRGLGPPALLVVLLIVVGASCAAPARIPTAAPARDANLLLVTLDTVRADRLGAYGYAGAETPALDRLAAGGVRFTEARTAVPLTLPSHATLLSGLEPLAHGVHDNGGAALPDRVPTLATHLAAAGYRTGAFVGAFVLDGRFGLDRGFEVYDDDLGDGRGDAPELHSERRGEVVVERAVAWLRQAASGDGDGSRGGRRPFFAWVHLYDAHAPYRPPQPFAGRHADPYDGEIAYVDAQVGRLVAELDHLGVAGDTVVVVAADHGEALGDHGERSHGLLLYEPVLRVPLLIRAPGLAAGSLVTTPVGLVDLAPTLAGLLDRPFSPGGGAEPAAGRDLAADLLAGRQPAAADLYAETAYPASFGWSPLASLRRRDLKYVQAPRPELYDLAADPGETTNLAAEQPRQAAGFAAALAELHRASRGDPRGDAGAAEKAADEETRARLASLGYAAPRRAAAAAVPQAALADPKDRVDVFRSYEEAVWALEEGRPAEAAAQLQPLVEAEPRNPVFLAKLGQALRRRGDPGSAVAFYRRAAEADPDDPEAWRDLAVALQEAGRPRDALAAVEQALARDPHRPEAENVLGISYLALGDPAAAASAFQRARRLDPDNPRVHNNLGNVLRRLSRPAEAESAYREAIRLAPRFADAWNGLGTLLADSGRPAQALPCFERALELAPGQHEIRLNRAIALDLAGDRPGALEAYRDFLDATEGAAQFASQRRAAAALMARLSADSSGARNPGRLTQPPSGDKR